MHRPTLIILYSIGILAAALAIILIPNPTEAQTQIQIDNFHAKVVITFDRPGLTETQIQSFLTNNVWPDIRDNIIIPKLDNNFDPGYTLGVELKVSQISSSRWELYPDFVISGTANLNKQQLINGFDNTIDSIKDAIQIHMDAQGATNVKYHLHKSVGSVDIIG